VVPAWRWPIDGRIDPPLVDSKPGPSSPGPAWTPVPFVAPAPVAQPVVKRPPAPVEKPVVKRPLLVLRSLLVLRGLLLLRSLQLTAGVGPANQVFGLLAGPHGRIRCLIGPECCVTGSERALELDRGRDGRLRARRTPDLLHPAQRRRATAAGRRAPGTGAGQRPARAPGNGRHGRRARAGTGAGRRGTHVGHGRQRNGR
jgi:hypothetical protein